MWILDTSVAVKWFFTDESGHARAREVLNRLVERPDEFAVPLHFFFELAAVLVRKSGFQKQFAHESLTAVYQLGIPTFEIGEDLSGEAIAMACRYRVSYYDALFAALARNLKGIWLTADQKALKRTPPDVCRHLTDYS